MEKENTERLEKIYISKTIFTLQIIRIRERISFKLKLTKGSNVGGTESESDSDLYIVSGAEEDGEIDDD